MNKLQLLDRLKKLSNEYSIYDLIKVRNYLEKDMVELPPKYKDYYINTCIGYYTKLLNELKSLNKDSIFNKNEEINIEKYNNLIDRIENSSSNCKEFVNLSKIIVPYLVFIKKSPLHIVGMKFPGGKSIVKKNNQYYCPVKSKQLNNKSLCEFCVSQCYENINKNNR